MRSHRNSTTSSEDYQTPRVRHDSFVMEDSMTSSVEAPNHQPDSEHEAVPGPDVADETGSTHSTFISRTSTQEFHHVPFEQFTQQIKELCHLLWPPNDNYSRVGRVFGGRSKSIVGKLRAKSRTITSRATQATEEVHIERLHGGGYNRVIGLTRFPGTDSPTRLILRIPRFEFARHDREVAATRFVQEYTSIPVPDVKFVDFTSNNPLGDRYVVQSRLPGHDLQDSDGLCCYPYLTHEQKCIVAKELAEILLELYQVMHPLPGHIEASNLHDGNQHFHVRHFELDWNFGVELEPDLNLKRSFFEARPFQQGWIPKTGETRPYEETTSYFMLAQFGRWKALELRRDPVSIALMKHYDRLVEMTEQMDDLGFLGGDINCLCHRDLNPAPRNIMAEIDASGSLKITGILDWDSLIFAPRYVACVPPMWLWAWNSEEEEDESKANDKPATPQQEEIKKIFEETVGSWFCEYAYAAEYRLARRLFTFAHRGLRSNMDLEELDELLADWNKLYQSHKVDSRSEAKDSNSIESKTS